MTGREIGEVEQAVERPEGVGMMPTGKKREMEKSELVVRDILRGW